MLTEETFKEKWDAVQPLIDCRLCDYFRGGYLPCVSTAKCRNGDMWNRTKIVQLWRESND